MLRNIFPEGVHLVLLVEMVDVRLCRRVFHPSVSPMSGCDCEDHRPVLETGCPLNGDRNSGHREQSGGNVTD